MMHSRLLTERPSMVGFAEVLPTAGGEQLIRGKGFA